MYKIIGADQKEYGPVSLEQLREWVAQRRANAATLVQIEGNTEWKPLGTLPEFSQVFAQPPPPLLASTGTLGHPSEAELLADAILANDYQLRVFHCFGRAWNLLFSNFGLSMLGTLIIWVLYFGLSLIPYAGFVADLLLGSVLLGGLDLMFLKMIRGEKAAIENAFAGFGLALGQLVLGGLVSNLLVGIGLLLLLLPGIYLLVAWMMFTPLLIIDKKLDFWPAMELSRRVVTRHWFRFFGLFLLAFVVLISGVLALGIGIIFTIAWATAAIVYAYEDVFHPPAAV